MHPQLTTLLGGRTIVVSGCSHIFRNNPLEGMRRNTMATLLLQEKYDVLMVEEGHRMYVREMIPENLGRFADVEHPPEGNIRVTFRKDAIVVAERVSGTLGSAASIRFVREPRDAPGLRFVSPRHWARARVALTQAMLVPVRVRGGFSNAVAYEDEIAISDYSGTAGVAGWIIRSCEIGIHLDALPPLRNSGKTGAMWIDSVGSPELAGQWAAKVSLYDPRAKDPPSYFDSAIGGRNSANRQTFLVEFDTGSRIVTKIIRFPGEEECASVCYTVTPAVRHIELKKRLHAPLAAIYFREEGFD